MRLHRFALLGTLLLGATGLANATSAPSAMDFARHAPITGPVLSPDGRHLAVALKTDADKGDGENIKHEIAIMELPSLRITARLGFARYTMAGQMLWVSNDRLLVSEARESGTLDAPGLIGELVALDADGKNQRVIYSFIDRGRTIRAKMNIMSMPRAYPRIAGLPEPRNGHVYLSFSIMPSNANGQSYDTLRTELYDVDTVTGTPSKVDEIQRGDMSFLVHDNKALYAYGTDDKLDPIVFRRGDSGWIQLDPARFGKMFRPMYVPAGSNKLYALHSAKGGPDQLVQTDLDGSNLKILASSDFGSVEDIFWGPRSARAPFAATFSGVYQGNRPAVTYLPGNERWSRIHQQLMQQFPTFFIDFAGMSDNGSTVLVHAYSGSNPGTYALLDASNLKLTPLFQSTPWLKTGEIGERRPIRFRNREGLELDGFLTLPRGVAPKHLPMVLIPHGGPIGPRDEWTYDPDAAFLASRGYAVLQVNYRGSGGRGLDFERSGYGQFATGMQTDMIDGVRWAIAEGYADKDRIGVYGGSFGGYSSLMQPILAPELYKAAIDYVGVYDWTIEFDRADTKHTRGGRSYWAQAIGDRAEAHAISPVAMIEKFNVPVLIVHGGSDQRVPIQNAEALRSKLEQMGRPFDWLVFPKEGHGFYTEGHREALYQKMEGFFAHYLGGQAHAEAVADVVH